MAKAPIGQPKFGSKRTTTPRRILMDSAGGVYFPQGKTIDGSLSRDPLNTGDLDVLVAGLLMGKITASGKYAPAIIGVLSSAHTSDSATSLTVSAATAVEIVRRFGTSGTFNLTGPPSAAGTVATVQITYSNVNTTTGVITITPESTDFISGSFVQPEDGSESALTVIGDGYGIKVTDENDANADVPFTHTLGGQAFLIGGVLDSSRIRNWPSDTSLQAQIVSWLSTAGVGHYTFDHLL